MIEKCTRRPKNKSMRQLYDELRQDNWIVSGRGAPDYFCWKVLDDGQVAFICVEAMRKATYRLRKHQRAVMESLAKAGVRCYRYNCDTGKYQWITFEKPS